MTTTPFCLEFYSIYSYNKSHWVWRKWFNFTSFSNLRRCCKIHDACYEAISNHPNLCPFESSVYWKIYSRDDTCTGCGEFRFYSKVICNLRIIYQVVKTRSGTTLFIVICYDLWSALSKTTKRVPNGILRSRNPYPKLGHSYSRAYFQSRILPDFALKTRIPSFK